MEIPKFEDIEVTLENAVVTATLNRNDMRNALTGTAIIEDLLTLCDWINRNHAVGAMVITGAGKAFSAGGNIKDMRDRQGLFGESPIDQQNSYRRGIQSMSMALYRLEVPLIAAVNGPAIGAGLDLICMCDIRLGCQYAKVGETFLNLGLIPGDGGAWFLPRVVGLQRAAEMTFSGRVVGPEEAQAIGLFLELVEPEQLLKRATDMAESYARQPREALRMSKRLLQLGQRMPLNDFLDFCASQQALCHTSDQYHSAIEAMFSQK